MSMAQIGSSGFSRALQSIDVSKKAKLPWVVSLYLFCLVVPMGYQLGPLALSTQRLLLLIVTVPLMAGLLMGRYGRVFATDWLFALHILWAGIALLVNNPDRAVEQIGSVGMEFLGGYAIGRVYIRDQATFLALCKRLALFVCLALPFAIYETITGRPILLETIGSLPGISSVAPIDTGKRLELNRVQMVFAHPIHFGLFCSIVMSLTFVGLKGVISDGRRWITTLIVGLSGFFALSSGALLALVLQMGLILWAGIFASMKQRWWLLFGLFVLAYVLVDIVANRTPILVFLSYMTFSEETAYWRTIIFEWGIANIFGSEAKGVASHFWFGLGLNDWARPAYMYSGSMDNFWLLMAVSYGVPGFLFLAIGYLSILVRIIRLKIEDVRLALCRRAWVFTFMGITFTLSTVHIWGSLYSFFAFMFGAGVWMLTAPMSRPSTTDQPPPTVESVRPPTRYTRFPADVPQ